MLKYQSPMLDIIPIPLLANVTPSGREIKGGAPLETLGGDTAFGFDLSGESGVIVPGA